MVVGFNHNFRYKGVLFHVQTEDGGMQNPFITTLLYRGGTIIASKKTNYADILKIEMLEKVVEELMKDQHKEMLRQLKAGAFDDRGFPGTAPATPQQELPTPIEPEQHQEPQPNLDELILDYLVSNGNKK